MAIDLLCPNCGAIVGHADSSDNYKEKYLYDNGKGEPMCNNCGSGSYSQNYMNYIFLVAICLGIGTILLIIFTH